ncbi:MAG: FHA domain-containing protein [Anaerolineae bacterium]
MNTKTLQSPFPSDENTSGSQRDTPIFDLSQRKAVIDWEASQAQKLQIMRRDSPEATRILGLYIIAQNIELVVDLHDLNIIGRSYPQNGQFEGIDFSAFDAYTLGVSRKHLILKRYDDQLLIIDNNSTNGTYLNDEKLKPLQAYQVQHDDHVRLGGLEIIIKFD